MKTRNSFFSITLGFAFLLAACGGTSAPTETTSPHSDAPTADSMQGATADDAPAWFSASFADARTGESFSIQGLSGKVVLVETMAMWCSNCLRQQGQVKALHEMLGERDDFISIGLDVDPFEDVASLKGYVESNGFNWLYAVAPEAVSSEISSLYGDQFLNPSSTPMLVIDRHGVAHPLPFGVKSAEELLEFIQPFLDEGM